MSKETLSKDIHPASQLKDESRDDRKSNQLTNNHDNNMEKNGNNTTITVSEKTAEMYFLHKELSKLLDKVSVWNNKYNGVPDEKTNEHLQDEFFKEAYKAFNPFEQFLRDLLEDNIVNNIYEYNNTL